MVKKRKKKGESYRLGEMILEDKLALEGTMSDVGAENIDERIERLQEDLGPEGWKEEEEEYKELSRKKAEVDRRRKSR